MKKKTQNCPQCGGNVFSEVVQMETERKGVRVEANGLVDYDNAGQYGIVENTLRWDTRMLKCEGCGKFLKLDSGLLSPAFKKLVITVNTADEWHDPDIDYAVATLSMKRMARIKELAAVVKRLDVYRISEFANELDYLQTDYDTEPEEGCLEALKEFEESVECVTLNVTDNDFYWSGYYKHTNIRWETASVPLTVLDEDGDYDLREKATIEEEEAV